MVNLWYCENVCIVQSSWGHIQPLFIWVVITNPQHKPRAAWLNHSTTIQFVYIYFVSTTTITGRSHEQKKTLFRKMETLVHSIWILLIHTLDSHNLSTTIRAKCMPGTDGRWVKGHVPAAHKKSSSPEKVRLVDKITRSLPRKRSNCWANF